MTVLGDLLIMVDGTLRLRATPDQHPLLREALIGLHSAVLAAQPAPLHRVQGWGDAIESFKMRFTAASLGKPQAALDVADHSAKRLFDTLPIHISMRELDEEVVYGAVRFHMIAISQEMQRRIAAAGVIRQLLA